MLLVEDYERVAQTVAAAMVTRGHTVVVGGCIRVADEALAMQSFDVAVLDIGLPAGSGRLVPGAPQSPAPASPS